MGHFGHGTNSDQKFNGLKWFAHEIICASLHTVLDAFRRGESDDHDDRGRASQMGIQPAGVSRAQFFRSRGHSPIYPLDSQS